MISLGKSTLIFNLNPIFCIFLAYILLGEKLEFLTIISAIGAFGGMYFLTLNQIEGNDSNPILGITFATFCAFTQGLIQINIRIMSVCKMSWILRPALNGMLHLIFAIIIIIFFPGTINFTEYDMYDVVYLALSGMGVVLSMACYNWAFTFERASRITPISYVENVFTVICDVAVFNYIFVSTDYLGMGLIAL